MFLKRREGEEGDKSKEENQCIISKLPNNRGSRTKFSRENKEERKLEPYNKEEAGKIDQEVHDSINHDDVTSGSVVDTDTGKKRAATDTMIKNMERRMILSRRLKVERQRKTKKDNKE